MCGILGQLNSDKPIEENTFLKMIETLTHRGPDDFGLKFFESGRIALGHRRLSIIDLSSSARQPMSNEHNDVWVVFNGEIYNFRQLRTRLEKKGHSFRNDSDTEVLVHAYEEWGDQFLLQLQGIFAFGIWDKRRKRLFLARDHLGVKPLYYFCDKERFYFASQIRAIIADNSVPRRINAASFGDYLAYGYVPFDRCIFEGMAKLPAGHYLIYQDGKVEIHKYWDFTYNGAIKDPEEAIRLVISAFRDAVEAQLVSDVPVGVFLSGGIDSSAVASLMKQSGSDPVRTFTIGFDDPAFDETPYASHVNRYLDAEAHQEILSYDLASELIPMFPKIYDEPFFDTSGIPTYLVSRLASRHVKVILSGDGGDEIFAGYLWYDRFVEKAGYAPFSTRDYRIARILKHLFLGQSIQFAPIKRMRKWCDRVLSNPIKTYFLIQGFLDREAQLGLLTGDYQQRIEKNTYWLFDMFFKSNWPRITAAQYLDIKTYLVDDILTKVDRASMSHGLEVRVPLLDPKLVELSFNIQCNLQYGNGERKHLFKKALINDLPEEILTTRKKGFSVPIDNWMNQGLHNECLKTLKDGLLVQSGILDPIGTARFLNNCDRGKFLWLLLSAELWARTWLP